MSTITNVPRSHIEQGQRRKEVTANAGLDAIAGRMTDQATIDLTGETTTMTLAGLTVGAARVLRLTDADEALAILMPLDATYDAEDPTALEGEWTIVNTSGHAHTIKAVAGAAAPVNLPDGETIQVRFDGAEIYPVSGGLPTGYQGRYIVAAYAPAVIANGEVLLVHVLPLPVVLPAAGAGSAGFAGTVATANAVFSIQKNGAEVGTLTFAAATATATFAAASPASFAVGDRLSIVGPATADSTLANFTISLNLWRA